MIRFQIKWVIFNLCNLFIKQLNDILDQKSASYNQVSKMLKTSENKLQLMTDKFKDFKLDYESKLEALKHDYQKDIKELKDKLEHK